MRNGADTIRRKGRPIRQPAKIAAASIVKIIEFFKVVIVCLLSFVLQSAHPAHSLGQLRLLLIARMPAFKRNSCDTRHIG